MEPKNGAANAHTPPSDMAAHKRSRPTLWPSHRLIATNGEILRRSHKYVSEASFGLSSVAERTLDW